MAKPAIWGCSNLKKPKENEVKIDVLDAQDNVSGARLHLDQVGKKTVQKRPEKPTFES